jgi:hypothetical protein
LHLIAGESTLAANVTGNQEETSIRGAVQGLPTEARLLVNVRANVDPARLRSVTQECLQTAAGKAIRLVVEDLRSFTPARPRPTHRYRSVV